MAPSDARCRTPDVLILYTDQWRWDAIGRLAPRWGCRSHRLATDGVHLDQAFVRSPACMPSRAPR